MTVYSAETNAHHGHPKRLILYSLPYGLGHPFQLVCKVTQINPLHQTSLLKKAKIIVDFRFLQYLCTSIIVLLEYASSNARRFLGFIDITPSWWQEGLEKFWIDCNGTLLSPIFYALYDTLQPSTPTLSQILYPVATTSTRIWPFSWNQPKIPVPLHQLFESYVSSFLLHICFRLLVSNVAYRVRWDSEPFCYFIINKKHGPSMPI